MRDNLEWLENLKVSQIIHDARHRILKVLQQEYTNEAKAYLNNRQEQGRPFIDDFSQEPTPIIEVKTFLNALFEAEDTFRDLETALSGALGQQSIFSLLSLANNSALVDKAFNTIELLAHCSEHFFYLFKNELSVVLPWLSKLHYCLPSVELSQDNLSAASFRVGLFAGHTINQMNPANGQVDYSLLMEVGAIVPVYMRQLSSFIEQNLSKVSNNTSQTNKATLNELSQLGEQLGRLIQHSATGKLFFLSNLVPIIRHIQHLLSELTHAAGSLNDTVKNTLREYLATLKLNYITGVFALIDTLEIEYLLTAGRLSTPLMLQIKPIYETLAQLMKDVLNLSQHGESLVKLEDRRFIELRLAPIQQRLQDLKKSDYLIEQAQEKLIDCVASLGEDVIVEPSVWNLYNVSRTMDALNLALLKTNYGQLEPYLVAIEHPIVSRIAQCLASNPSNQAMSLLLSELEKILNQAKTDRLFKITLHESLIESVYQKSKMVLFPYDMIHDEFKQLQIMRQTRLSTVNCDDAWEQYAQNQNRYDNLLKAKRACDAYLLSSPSFSFYDGYRLERLHEHLCHQPNIIYLKVGQAIVQYELLEYHQKQAYTVHFSSLESAQKSGLFDCFIWDKTTLQLFFIDLNKTAVTEVVLKNTQLFQTIIEPSKSRIKQQATILSSDLSCCTAYLPGIVHKGEIALSWLSNTLTVDSKLKAYEPYLPKLLQELSERGHIYSDIRQQWVQWYAELQPYLMAYCQPYVNAHAFDKKISAILSGDFFSADVTVADSAFFQQLDEMIGGLSVFIDNQLNGHVGPIPNLDATSELATFHPYRHQLLMTHPSIIPDVIELMPSDKPMYQMIHAALKRQFKLELALKCLPGIAFDQNLLMIGKNDWCYNNFLFLQDSLLEFKQYLTTKNKSYTVIKKQDFQLFLEEKNRLEQAYLAYHQTILEALKRKQISTGSGNQLLVLSAVDDSLMNMYLQLHHLKIHLLNDDSQVIEQHKLYLYSDANGQQVHCKWMHYGVVQCERLPETILQSSDLAKDTLSSLREARGVAILKYIYAKREADIASNPSIVGVEEAQDIYAWIKLQQDELKHAQLNYEQWLGYFNSYLQTKSKQDKQSANVVWVYLKPFIENALQPHELFRENVNIEHHLNCFKQIMSHFFSTKTQQLDEKITWIKPVAIQLPLPLQAGLFTRDIDERPNYLMKTTDGSKQIAQLKQMIDDCYPFLNTVVLQRLYPSSGVPFPQLNNPEQRLRESGQLLGLKRLANLLYYSSELFKSLESIHTNAYMQGYFDFANKVTYVWRFVNAYLYFIQTQTLVVQLLKDRHWHAMARDLLLKTWRLVHHCHQTIHWYGSDLTADRTNTSNDGVILPWVTMMTLLPEKLNSHISDDESTQQRLLRLKQCAEKTTRNIETIIADLNPVVRYGLLCMDGFKIRAVLKDFKQIWYEACIGLNKKTKDNLQAIATTLLSELILEADLIEYRLGLQYGLFSTSVFNLTQEWYKGLVTPLVDDSTQRLVLCSSTSLMNKRLVCAQNRLQQAGNTHQYFLSVNQMMQTIVNENESQVGSLFGLRLCLIKSMLQGFDLHQLSLIDALSRRLVDCFVFDHGSLYYIDLEGKLEGSLVGDLYLLRLPVGGVVPRELEHKPVLIQQGDDYLLNGFSMENGWDLTTLNTAIVTHLSLNFDPVRHFKLQLKKIDPVSGQTLQETLASSSIKLGISCATLIQYGEQYFIYGRKKLGQWAYTPLHASIVNKNILDFSTPKRIIISEFNAYKTLYQHIVLVGAHQQNKAQRLVFHPKQQTLYDEIAVKHAHIFPIQVKSTAKLYTMLAKEGKRYPNGATAIYVTEQSVKQYILDNSSFTIHKPMIDLHEHCWGGLDVFENELSVRLTVIPDRAELDVIWLNHKEVLFVKQGKRIKAHYRGLENDVVSMTVDNARIVELLYSYPHSFGSCWITNLPHLAEIKAYLTVWEINRLIQRVDVLNQRFCPTTKEVQVIRKLSALCAQLAFGLYQDELLNEDKSRDQIQWLQSIQSVEQEKQLKAHVANAMDIVCAQHSFGDWVKDEYVQTLKTQLQQVYDTQTPPPELEQLNDLFINAKQAFDNTHPYHQLEALRLALFEFDAYLTTTEQDQSASIKKMILATILQKAQNQTQPINERMSAIINYLNTEQRLQFLLAPPVFHPLSIAYWQHLVHKLLECLGLRRRPEVSRVDTLVAALFNQATPFPLRPAYCIGLFAPKRTSTDVLATWEQAHVVM